MAEVRYAVTADGRPLRELADPGLAITVARDAAFRTGAFTSVQLVGAGPARTVWSSVAHGVFSSD